MHGLAATENGLLALGAQQADLRPRFINYAADHFALLARGEKPPKPEPFLAEIVAKICAEVIGEEVPMPIQTAEKRTYVKRANGADEDEDIPAGSIEAAPEARVFCESHGLKKIFPKTLYVVSAFLKYPNKWWKTNDLARVLGRGRTSTTMLCHKFREVGILVSEGERAQCKWKLAEMPPRV